MHSKLTNEEYDKMKGLVFFLKQFLYVCHLCGYEILKILDT